VTYDPTREDPFRNNPWEWVVFIARVIVSGVIILVAVFLICSCAPHPSAIAPQTDTVARVPWSPNDRPVRLYVLNMERGIYHGYWSAAGILHWESGEAEVAVGGAVDQRLPSGRVLAPGAGRAKPKARKAPARSTLSITYPFLWSYQARGRYVLDFHVMTGATLPDTTCVIELRRTDGRP